MKSGPPCHQRGVCARARRTSRLRSVPRSLGFSPEAKKQTRATRRDEPQSPLASHPTLATGWKCRFRGQRCYNWLLPFLRENQPQFLTKAELPRRRWSALGTSSIAQARGYAAVTFARQCITPTEMGLRSKRPGGLGTIKLVMQLLHVGGGRQA
jgi:hypothetical protein